MAPGLPDPDDPLLDRLREALRGEYDVERRLGAGGMGYVYLGRDPALDMPVAIKVLRPELATARAAERFLGEARTLASVKHVNVVTIHRVLERHGLFLYAMELLGGTLADRLRTGPLPPVEAFRLGLDLLAGIGRVHETGIVHRDIKPGNVFVGEGGGPAKIGDFGIAHIARPPGEPLTDTGMAPGTPGYMAPEHLAQMEVGPPADLYAVSMVLYEALAGRRWKSGTDPGRADWSGVPRRMGTVLRRGLVVEPSGRWPSAQAYRTALLKVRRKGVPPAALVLVALAAASLGRYCLGAREGVSESDLAVLPFSVIGGGADLGEVLAIQVQVNLERAWGDSGFRVTPPSLSTPYGRSLAAESLPSGAWDRLHTRRIVRGQVTVRDDSLVVSAGLYGPREPAVSLGQVTGDDQGVAYRLGLAVVRAVRPDRAARYAGYRRGRNAAATKAFVDGTYQFEQDNWEAAERYFREAIAADSLFADAWWGLYKVQSWRRKPHEVDLAAVFTRHRSQFSELDQLLIQAELAATIPERVALYARAVARAPYDAYPRLMLGNELFHRGGLAGLGFAPAIAQLDSAVVVNPYLASTYSMLAWAHIRLGNAAEAREALDRYDTYGRHQPEENFSMLQVLELAWLARFDPRAFAQQLGPTARSAGGLPSLAQTVRLGLAFGIPEAQQAIAHALEAEPDHRLIGVTAQAVALLSRGRITEALGHLEEAARVSGDQEYAFEAAQWALVLPVIGVPGVPAATRAEARARMSGWASVGPRAARARWTLLLDAIVADSAAADRRLADLAATPGAAALAGLGTALTRAGAGDTLGAIRLSDTLMLHVVAAEVADPLQRAVLFLSRGRWLADRDRARADAAWRWYENADLVGWPEGYLQAAELDWALETHARFLRARAARAAGDPVGACVLLRDGVARWTGADSAYASLRDTLQAWARACPPA